ncbi:MAG TPA: TIGR03936 family radical SAM-associated protein, partial [Nitrospirota bacterium]|nr:TIGR03936 family radical SAM-associated protein [Nitrospirota bacterium]
ISARIRLKFARTGRVRFLSHLDFMSLFQRAASRARVPLAFSQGFNPHPKIAFGPALPVGMESEAEYLDMETDPFLDLLETVKGLNRALPEGIRVLEARVVPKKAPSLSGSITRHVYEVRIPREHAERVEERARDFLERDKVLVLRDGKQKDIKPGIESINRKDAVALTVILRDSEQLRPRVQDVIEQFFGIARDQALLVPVTRVSQEWNDRGTWRSPMDSA